MSNERATTNPGSENPGSDSSRDATYDFIVLGAGLSGLSVAAALLDADSALRVAVVEAERAPARHSSGRSAGMIRLVSEDRAITALAREGRATIQRVARETVGDPRPVDFRPVGSLLLGARGRVDPESDGRGAHGVVERRTQEGRGDTRREDTRRGDTPTDTDAADTSWLDTQAVLERAPFLGEPAGELGGLWTPGDGSLDVPSWVAHLVASITARGGELCVARRGVEPLRSRGRFVGLLCDDVEMSAARIVVATGAWAGDWASRQGLGIRLEPRRRHVIATAPWSVPIPETPRNRVVSRSDERQNADRFPWVWDLDNGFYVRPSATELWWSSCDEVAEPPGESSIDPGAEGELRAKVAARFPQLPIPSVERLWSGHRTFTPDGRFLLGADPRLEGWYWAVGLGGHGVTVSPAVGRLVAEVATDHLGPDTLRLLAPHRFRDSVVPTAG